MQRLSSHFLVALATCAITATGCRMLQAPGAPVSTGWSTVAARPVSSETELTPLEATFPDAGPTIAANLSAVQHFEH